MASVVLVAPSRVIVSLSLAAAMLIGCKSRDDPGATGTKVTAESDYDATEPIVDEDYRFRLDRPGPGWKLLRRDDIRRILPDALAGSVSDAGWAGGVTISRFPGVSLEQVAELLAQSEPNAIMESSEAIDFRGFPARRDVFVLDVEGSKFRYVRVHFMRGEFHHLLLAWGTAAQTQAANLEPFFTAFSLLDGEIHVPETSASPKDAEGVAWELSEGRYRSLVGQIALEPSPGWHFLVGRDLTIVNAEAEIGLAHQGSSATLLLMPSRTRRDADLAIAERRLAYEGTLGEWTPDVTRSIAGRSVEFVRFSDSFEYQLGVLCLDGSMIELVMWYPSATRSEALAAFDALMAELEVLTSDELELMTRRFLARDSTTHEIAVGTSIHGGVFRDFAHALEWREPKGLYDHLIGEELAARPGVTFYTEEQLDGLALQIAVHEGEAARLGELHEEFAGTLAGRRDDEVELGAARGSRSIGEVGQGSETIVQAVVSAAHRGDAIVLVAWGEAALVSREELEQAIAGLRLHPELKEVEQVGARYVDRHFGFSIEPPEGWTRTPIELHLAQARGVGWKRGRSQLLVMALGSQLMPEQDWFESFMEQFLRDAVAAEGPLGEPKRLAGNLGGRPSRRLVYAQQQAEIVSDGALLLMLVAVGDEDEAERFRSSLRLHAE